MEEHMKDLKQVKFCLNKKPKYLNKNIQLKYNQIIQIGLFITLSKISKQILYIII